MENDLEKDKAIGKINRGKEWLQKLDEVAAYYKITRKQALHIFVEEYVCGGEKPTLKSLVWSSGEHQEFATTAQIIFTK